MATWLAAELCAIERVGHTILTLEGEIPPAHVFLIDLLQHRRARAFDRLVRGLSSDSGAGGEAHDPNGHLTGAHLEC